MKRCKHWLVEGLGMMGDALTCIKCGYSFYPDDPFGRGIRWATIQGRVVRGNSYKGEIPEHLLKAAIAAKHLKENIDG